MIFLKINKITMETYKVTEKHKGYKVGVILEFDKGAPISEELTLIAEDDEYLWTESGSAKIISEWEAQGWIEEIQEPKYTEADMISFAEYCNDEYVCEIPLDCKYHLTVWEGDNK